MYIVLAVLIFGILIFVHELGHFLAARACDVKVLEFSIGMGPLIFKKQGKETLYSLRLFPFGGFCAMEGEDEVSEDEAPQNAADFDDKGAEHEKKGGTIYYGERDAFEKEGGEIIEGEKSGDERAFYSKKIWQKAIILVSGAAMNFIVGFLMILLVYSNSFGFSSAEITEFFPNCPYEGETMLQEGDVFYKIDGHRIYFTQNVSTYLNRSESDYHDIVVLRDGKKVRLDDFYMPLVEYENENGTELKYGFYFGVTETGFLNNVKYSWYCSLDFVRTVWRSLGDLVTGAVGLRELSGPVGVVDVVNQVAAESETAGTAILNVVYLFALIAINLAVMNLLPIPALDGGRVFLMILTFIIEKISRRKLNPKYEGYLHSACFALLMVLSVVILLSDVIKIILR